MRRILTAVSLLAVASCNNPVGSGKDLVDGCYYLGREPVLRIEENHGELLIPGEVNEIEVETRRRDITQAIFSPGFDLVKGPPLSTKLNKQFPKVYHMMDPLASVPTILVHGDANEVLGLKLGPSC